MPTNLPSRRGSTGRSRRSAFACALSVLILAGGGRRDAEPRFHEGSLAIVAVDVLPMDRDTILPDRTVVIRGGRIVSIRPRADGPPPGDVPVLDGQGRTLLPGLVDFHVHLRDESELESYRRYGVTTIVNMRGLAAHLDLRDRLRAGFLQGPRIFTAGPLIDGDPPIRGGAGTRVVTDSAEAPGVVADHEAAGYDFIKVYNNLDPGVLTALCAEAHQRHMAVVGHLPRRPVRREGLRRALAAGIDMIAHGEEIFFTEFGGAPDSLLRSGRYRPPSDEEIRDVAEAVAGAGTAVTPNLSFTVMVLRMLEDLDAVFATDDFERLSPDVREMWRTQNPTRRSNLELFAARERYNYEIVRRLTGALRDAGVLLLAGTDASAPGLYPGRSLHLEIEELAAAGLTPWQAVATATTNAGRFLSEHVAGAPPLGVVAPGYVADLILVDGDPRTDLGTLLQPWRVVQAGMILPGEGP